MFTIKEGDEMQPIETKELRGLSIRALAWLISSTVTVVAFIVTSYFLIQSKIGDVNEKVERNQSQKVSDDKIYDLKLQVIQADVNRINTQLEALQRQSNNSTSK